MTQSIIFFILAVLFSSISLFIAKEGRVRTRKMSMLFEYGIMLGLLFSVLGGVSYSKYLVRETLIEDNKIEYVIDEQTGESILSLVDSTLINTWEKVK